MGEGQKITLVLISVIFFGQLCWTQEDESILKHHTSTYNLLCYDACQKHTNSYYWCNTKEGWDYCSLQKNTDYKGNECNDDHPCGRHDEEYFWCNNKAGSWGYCGNVEPKSLRYKPLHKGSNYQEECRDECLYDKSKLYYTCPTDKGWDYCSPSPDVTYKNEPCKDDHPCNNYGEYYSWCSTDSSWDYCGIIEGTGICGSTTRRKREADHLDTLCLFDHSKQKITKLKPKRDTKTITEGRTWIGEMAHIISKWNNSYLHHDNMPNIITTKHLRLDVPGLVQRDKVIYYGLQINFNGKHPERKSTIVALVFLPYKEDIPERHVHRALSESYCNRAKVFVEVISDSNYRRDCNYVMEAQ